MSSTFYLAGKVSGDPDYRAKFEAARRRLEQAGFVVLDPSILPSKGFSYDAYIRMSTAMMDECEHVIFLPDWIDSKGAQYERGRAIALCKHIQDYEKWLAIADAPKICEISEG